MKKLIELNPNDLTSINSYVEKLKIERSLGYDIRYTKSVRDFKEFDGSSSRIKPKIDTERLQSSITKLVRTMYKNNKETYHM